jgi:peptidoglycan/LPS O-acetylase OafA/YrhL
MGRIARADPHFRPDLEGLRGVAILLVVACHGALPGMAAGFIGVDVFFVLSGFLITGLLVSEIDATGGMGLARFYARRARRILPAAAVVLVATLVVATLVYSPLDVPRVTSDAMAAGLSVANIHFAIEATDYFAPVDPSPILHFWSLSVEEQFYLAWPALLLLGARLGRPRLGMVAVTGLVLVGTLALGILVSGVSGPWAYYLLPTRAWQLAAGAALALAGDGLTRLPRTFALPLGWLGAGLLVAAIAWIGPSTPYPGIAAAVPTVGTLFLIAAGARTGSPGWLVLQRRPLRWIGRISYSLYLWHWPILVLGPATLMAWDPVVAGSLDPLALRWALVGLAIIAAAVSWRLIEEPFRVGRLSRGGHRLSLAMAASVVLSIAVGSTAMGLAAQRDVAAAELDASDPGAGADVVDAWSTASDRPVVLDPDALDPSESGAAPTLSASPAPSSTPTASAGADPSVAPIARPTPRLTGRIPSGLTPGLRTARDDDDGLIADGCGLGLAGSEPPLCAYGDPKGSITVALVGDSHAAAWFPAFERSAKRSHWRLIPFTKSSCVFVDLPVWSPYLDREYTECARWRDRVVSRLQRVRPDLTVIASTRWFPTVDPADDDPARQGVAMARLIKRLPGAVAILADTPRSEVDVPACLARHRDAIEACTTRRAAAFTWRHLRRERVAARRSDATLIDLSAAVCPTDPCPPIIGRRLVYRDHHHLTATFAASLAPDLAALLAPILRRGSS